MYSIHIKCILSTTIYPVFLVKTVFNETDKYMQEENIMAKTFVSGSSFGGFGEPPSPQGPLSDLAENQLRIQQAGVQNNQVGSVQTVASNTQKGTGTDFDWRARLRPKNGGASKFWSDGEIMRPLKESGGLVWQYTPSIFVAGRANYNMADFYGSNYPFVTYLNSTPPSLVVVQDFTANTIDEAKYMLGVMHFLRTATKSYYGDAAVASGDYGTPPPVLVFEYLGDHGFNKVPVVVTDYQYDLNPEVDYVPVKTGGETTFVPTMTNISITLQPSYTPHKLRKRFNLDAFASGASYKDGFI